MASHALAALPASAADVRAWTVRHHGEVFAVVSLPLDLGAWLPQLTNAERDIVGRVLHGDSNRDIALARGTSVRTVANQLAAIYQKLSITSRADLAIHVIRLQLGRGAPPQTHP
ncbi:helix-turn-helix transcriptional regulator [Pyxidicoccus parkwayensis]|jgi:DNA-binding CsgD family transcriptional regulator|uniref:Helix-turn-helix transcriptional regulator n=1 Tax=Pyxidicoccus parkwayensis TaxID=2813578 RepID=A0ABX7NTB9_9BACT|nr:helix-turn-helix transcriptional regulator [Pyxidicoccus parkwaysis]QSQ21963.1 helix-turn-helix transcriptional regulator [Pyxidicoccus parkwaysis]